ncbi:MAG: hypothetical protein QOE58_1158 [Actinomycetota bacterium]|nr:hypothetical protein [Actinomycetota bacterium]
MVFRYFVAVLMLTGVKTRDSAPGIVRALVAGRGLDLIQEFGICEDQEAEYHRMMP